MEDNKYLFTSESVSEGHPDKVCDRISDMVVDSYLSRDPFSRVACETLTTTNKVVLAGEIRGPKIEKEEIIKKALIKMGADNQNVENIIKEGKIKEANSNQILDFTREVKNMEEKDKIKIIETLWQIIYSNEEADMYETNLMRRLAGLLYIDSKTMGDIKNKVSKENL